MISHRYLARWRYSKNSREKSHQLRVCGPEPFDPASVRAVDGCLPVIAPRAWLQVVELDQPAGLETRVVVVREIIPARTVSRGKISLLQRSETGTAQTHQSDTVSVC